MPWDPTLLFSIAAIALSGFVQSVTGFGFGLVSMALLPLAVPFADAYILVTLLNLVVCVMTFTVNRRHYRWRLGVGLVAGSCLAVPLGFYLMIHLKSRWLLGGLGLLICLFAAGDLLLRRGRLWRIPAGAGFPLGLVSGALSGAFNMGGPPAVAYAYAQPWSKEHTVALLQVMFGTASILRLLLVQSAGLMRSDLLSVAAFALLPLIAAIALGSRLLAWLPQEKLRVAVFVLLLLIGLKYLLQSC